MDVRSFFAAEPLLASGPGFASFGPGHLSMLALSLVAIVLTVWAYRRMPAGLGLSSPRRRVLLAIASALAIMRISHDGLCLATGTFTPSWWPLHLCNLCELLCILYALHPTEPLGLAVYGLALPSGMLALTFPGWSYCPLLSWASICGFAEHAGMVAFALSLLVGGDVRPRVRLVWVPCLALACYLAFTIPFNRAMGTNFGFTNWPIAGTPLMPLAATFGNPGYLVPYAAIIAGTILMLFWLGARHKGDG